MFRHGFPGSVPVVVSLLLSFLNRSVPDSSMNFELHMTLVETCVVAVWGLCWCNFSIYILGMSSSQLTFIVFRGVETTNQNAFLPTPGDVAAARHGGRKITLQIKGEW